MPHEREMTEEFKADRKRVAEAIADTFVEMHGFDEAEESGYYPGISTYVEALHIYLHRILTSDHWRQWRKDFPKREKIVLSLASKLADKLHLLDQEEDS